MTTYGSNSSNCASDGDESTKTFGKRTSCYANVFPSGFKTELKNLLEIYIPCVLTNFFRFLNPAISVIMCGNLSKLEFVASSLANSLIYAFGSSIDMGFSTAFDTLFAQIYGCDQKKKMGLILQKAVIIMTLVFLLIASFHLNIEPLLIFLGQDVLVSRLTTSYITFYLPGLYFDFQFLTLSRYLQNQNVFYPTMLSAFVSNIVNAISQYVALYVYGYGLNSSAILQGLSCFVMFSLQLGYILISKIYKDSWDGFSIKGVLENWGIIFRLGIPGILMYALEEWNFEVLTIIAGAMDTLQLGAQTIAFECASMLLIMSLGLEIAVTIRIGQYLGSGDVDRLKTFFRTSVVVGMTLSTLSFIFILVLRKPISRLFTNDLEIQNEGSDLLVILAFFQIFDTVACIGSGAIKACGRQYTGAVVMLISYYVVGLPLGGVLVYFFKFRINGMWLGLSTAILLEGIIFTIIIHRTDWKEACEKAISNAEYFDAIPIDDTQYSEEMPLIVKSPDLRKRRSSRLLSEHSMVILGGRRSVVIVLPETHDNGPSKPFIKTVILRIVTIFGVIFVFVGCLFLRIFVPQSLYLPCLPRNNITIGMYGSNSSMLCDSILSNVTMTF